MQEVELEVRAHRRQWEALHEASERDSAAIAQLTASKEQLEQELQERRENIRHLEGLLEEVCVCVCVFSHVAMKSKLLLPPPPTHPGWQ